jgi:hypothetical protein
MCLRRVVALVAALVMVHSLGEIGGAVLHLVTHLTDASPDHADCGAPEDPEDGCGGTFHLCGCCARPAFAVAAPLTVPPRADRILTVPPGASAPVTQQHVRALLRPPRSNRV